MIGELHRVVRLIEGCWGGRRALVLGDLMLDRYLWGEVERISPEAPVPVVCARRQSEQPGGAANVALNIAGLGAKAILLGFRGQDAEGDLLERRLEESGIDARLTVVPGHPTTSKLRIIGGKQQMLRLDIERSGGYPQEAFQALLRTLEEAMAEVDVLVLSDYAKGVLSDAASQRAIQLARRQGIPVFVDPKQRSFIRYRGATTICPNLQELALVTGITKTDLAANLDAAQQLVAQFDLEFLTVTLSEKGIAMIAADRRFVDPAVARQVFDVSGAGDTVIATLALAYASGLEPETAVQLANVTAGIVVSKVGTVPVQQSELLTQLMPQIELTAEEKVVNLPSLQARVEAWKASGNEIVFTNGCFDLLHIGHITLLEEARRFGDRLVVAINSDDSVRRLKGAGRPIVGEEHRARILAALTAVDAVVVFDAPTPLAVIEAIRPQIIVKGGDYSEETVVGAEEVRSWGGRVKIVPTVDGFSTTRLIAKAVAEA